MRIVRSVEILPPLRPAQRLHQRRRPSDGDAARHGHRREAGEVAVEAAPQGAAPFVAQHIAQEWCPAPASCDAARAAEAYRPNLARRRRRDLLPRV
jgi:hypothetical protein